MIMQTLQFLAAILIIIIVAAETVISAIKQNEVFDRRDSVVNFLIGCFAIMIGLLMKGLALKFFMSIQPFVLIHIPFTFMSAVVLFLLSDLQYYWFHRLGHISRFFWASHVIHHSSHLYNYSVGMRLPFTNGFYRFLFWSPLCLAGFSPEMIILMDALVNYYTFFLHTETIGKLGWLEKVLNTPSHHRVHHSSNPQYLDKNYGGVLIIWDRLFGTYVEEEEKTRYGLTKAFNSYNPVRIVFNEWQAMISDIKIAAGAKQVVKVMFGSPGWKPEKKKESSMQKMVSNCRKISFLPKTLIRTVCSLILSFFVFVLCTSFSPNESTDWALKKNENGIAVYTRSASGFDLKEIRVVNKVKSSLSGIVALLFDTKNYPAWMAGCKETRILKTISNHELYNYQVTDLPWPVTDRDVVTHFKLEQNAVTGIVTITKTAAPQFIPANEGYVRVRYLQAKYTLTPLSSDSVQIEMELQVDPGGSIPAWLINANIVSAPFKSTEQMIKRLPMYKSASCSFIKELPENL